MSRSETAGQGRGSTPNPQTVAAMRLRPEPPAVTRLSRRVLVSVALLAGAGIGGALIFAFQTGDRQPSQQELFTTERQQRADGLEDLPADYGDIPQLGPPLPGDLGGPIVRAREQGRLLPAEAMPVSPLDPQEQRRLAELEAARTSDIFFQARSLAAPALQAGLSGPALNLEEAVSRDRQTAFLTAEADRRTVAPDRVAAPASPFVLQAGSVIPAALVTGIRSDLPGQVTAQVTQHVYDSPTGNLLLIPQGTRIIGAYDNGVAFGQRRILLVWNRLIFPNGRSLVLERLPGADAGGYAGLEDGVDNHWWELARAAGLSTLLSVGTELTMDDEDRLVRALQRGAQDAVDTVGEQVIARQLQIAPTLTIRPGFPVRVIVTRDLVLEPYGIDP